MKVILGTGMAGLMLGYYHPDAILIGKEIKGQINSKFNLGPRVIQCDDDTLELIQSLNDGWGIGGVRIGFERNEKVHAKSDDDFKREYSLITRNTTKVEPSFLSGGRNQFPVIINLLDPGKSFEILSEYLLSTIRERKQTIINNSVENINLDTKEIFLSNEETILYDSLYNTIPLNIFNSFLEKPIFNPEVFELGRKHFYKCEFKSQEEKFLSEGYDYIYSVDKEYTRKTYMDDYIVYETKHELPKSKQSIQGNKILDSANLNIQIINQLNFKKFKDVEFVGRFAQWYHGILTNDVIRRAKQLNG